MPRAFSLQRLGCLPSLQTTFEFHYGKHHQAYVTNLNNQIAGKDLESLSIEEVRRGGVAGGICHMRPSVARHGWQAVIGLRQQWMCCVVQHDIAEPEGCPRDG